ncbi:MAG: hypothetical protein K9J12_14395 [Melioribacteraceae bacterium]|nr:hypothetical protein [Melioribacteraceae bacterium]MCF8263702.1 hypothetical protein [Melioribacteraceae bacterium]MCF8413573.1 hypothetical protein [Melioribacteraceae bacterium]
MTKNFSKLFFLILCPIIMFGQTNHTLKKGHVSYLSSQNVYVKFDGTDGISKGDTLFMEFNSSLKAGVVVENLSSRSCSGKILEGITLKIDDVLFAKISEDVETVLETKFKLTQKDSLQISNFKKVRSTESNSKFRGKFGIASYTNMANYKIRATQRWRYKLSYDWENIANSNFSSEAYFTFRYSTYQWQDVKSNLGKALKIYTLSFKYDMENHNLIFGRMINRNVNNIGAFDGISYNYNFDNNEVGMIIGSRPNPSDYGLNFKMFQTGLYYARTDTLNSRPAQSSVAIFEQTNNFNTDRRFIYLQHSNFLLENTSIFASSELDLYKRRKGLVENTFDLTSIFLSVRYSPIRLVSVSASYDARKNVIYYETYKNLADSLLDAETRQGLKFRVTLRPLNKLMISGNVNYRFLSGDPRPSKNYGGNISYSRVPYINSSTSFSFYTLKSNYLDGLIWSLRLRKYFFDNLLSVGISYKNVAYKFVNVNSELNQDILSFETSIRLFESLYCNMNYEGIFDRTKTFNRIYVNLSQRF